MRRIPLLTAHTNRLILLGAFSTKTQETWCKRAVDNARARAKKARVPCTIKPEDLIAVLPEDGLCPALKIKLAFGSMSMNAASLDKIIPHLGYVPGNVAIISNLANAIKSNGTSVEVMAVAKWLEGEIGKRVPRGFPANKLGRPENPVPMVSVRRARPAPFSPLTPV